MLGKNTELKMPEVKQTLKIEKDCKTCPDWAKTVCKTHPLKGQLDDITICHAVREFANFSILSNNSAISL